MLSNFKKNLQGQLEKSLKDAFPSHGKVMPPLELEIPADDQHGEFSSNIALKSSKLFNKPPMNVAEDFLAVIRHAIQSGPLKGKISRVEVKKPGFINFFLAPPMLYEILIQVFTEDMD